MRHEKYKDSGVEWIGEVPAHWSLKKLKFIADVTTGNRDTVDAVEGGIYPFFVRSDTIQQIDTFSFDGEGIFTAGDGDIGKIVHYFKGKCDFHQRVYCIYNSDINTKFLYYFFAEHFKIPAELSNAKSTVNSIRMPVLNNFIVPIPSCEEQDRIVDFLDDKTSKINSIIKELESEKEKLEVYKRELIAEVVTKGLNSNIPMKDSGVDWIGQVPEHWEIHPLFSVFKQNKVKNIGMENDNLLSLSYGNIIRKDIDTTFGLLPTNFENYQIVDKGYIILRLTDLQNDKKSLRTALVNEKGIITSAYIGLEKIISKCNTDYMHYLLHSYDLRKVFYSMGSGLRQSLNFDDIKRLPIVLPKDDEQKEIVEYLDYRVNKVESIKNKLQLQIEKLRDYRKIVIHEAVTGKVKIDGGAK